MFSQIGQGLTSNLLACIPKTLGGEHQRNRYLTALDKAFHDLAKDHLKGRDCGVIRIGYRKYEVGRHIIFYREIDAGLIEIVRVLHQRMDVESQLTEK